MSDEINYHPFWMTDHEAKIVGDILGELAIAVEKFPPFNSAHEGYAILLEEVEELWEEIRNNKHDDGTKQRKEAIQIAAMAMRFILDISDKGKHRNEIAS